MTDLRNMKIKYLFTFPFSMDIGGGGQVIKDITSHLKALYQTDFVNYETQEIDFDVLIVFGCTYLNTHMLNFYRTNGVKVVLYPIFDRMKPLWQFKAFSWMTRVPFLNIFKLRNQIFKAVDLIIVANESERRDLVEIYKADNSKITTMFYGVNDKVIELDKVITKNLFTDKYTGWTNFVFCPAAVISSRKNQIKLIKALKGTGIKLVLNNTNRIIDNLESEFHSLTKNDPNILCLERMDLDMMVSCYKNAKVSISVSQAETAGLVNLEAGYLGCNLVVSDLEALREYLQEYAIFINQNSEEEIRNAVTKAMQSDYNPKLKQFVQDHYTWDKYIDELLGHINLIVK